MKALCDKIPMTQTNRTVWPIDLVIKAKGAYGKDTELRLSFSVIDLLLKSFPMPGTVTINI